MSKTVFISLLVNLNEEHSDPKFQENLLKEINVKLGLNAEEFMLGKRFSVFFLSFIDEKSEITNKIEALEDIFKTLKHGDEIYLNAICEEDYNIAKSKIYRY